MGLDDFNKIENEIEKVEENTNEKDIIPVDMNFEKIGYYVFHLDELISLLDESYRKYVNAKLKHDLKKYDLQVNTNWNEENVLRANNNLPKITAQGQRDSVINLKVKALHVEMKKCEADYDYYKRVFNLIDKNFELLYNFFQNMKESEEKD